MKPGVYITCDVECSMGGALAEAALRPVPPARAMMGRYGEHEFGLPLITDILGEHDLAATFFVTPFLDEQGYPGAGEAICRFLLERQQDVQLHVHPCHAAYTPGYTGALPDFMAELAADRQRRLLAEGCQRLQRWTGRPPVAFRAGNLGASGQTLELLPAVGIRIDSSYAFPYAGSLCAIPAPQPFNGSRWYGTVLELAVSGFLQRRLPGLRPTRMLDLAAVSFAECREVIRGICAAGADAVLILHSFSLFKVRNQQYDGGRLNRMVAGRFRRLCAWLAEHREERPVRTCRELADAIDRQCYQASAVPPLRISTPLALLRQAAQLYNSLYWT